MRLPSRDTVLTWLLVGALGLGAWATVKLLSYGWERAPFYDNPMRL